MVEPPLCAPQGLPVVKVCDGDARRFCTRQLGPDGKPAKVKSIDIPVGQVRLGSNCNSLLLVHH